MKPYHQPIKKIGFSVSGIKHYDTEVYKNDPRSFSALSLTGKNCGQGCAHCNGILLHNMIDAKSPVDFITHIDRLAVAGCTGILVSGGCDDNGSVPLAPHIEGISYAKQRGFKVVVHTGLLEKETAVALKSANADQILMDVIGSEKTIRNVYGLNKTPEDFLDSLLIAKETGLDIAPHLVVGLDFGVIDGEYAAINMVKQAAARSFVLVVLTPKRGTKMQDTPPPPLPDVIDVFKYAADTLKGTRITLGCARPSSYTSELEKTAVDLMFAAISYPKPETVRYAWEQGFETYFFEQCCSLV